MWRFVNWVTAICRLASALTMVCLACTSVHAQPLVYCSEASPEGFDPALATSGATFDASSQTVYNRLAEIGIGSTVIDSGLAETWEISPDGLAYTFHLRAGVPFHTAPDFTPSRTLNADDVVFTFERQWRTPSPWAAYVQGGTYANFSRMSFPALLKDIVKVDDLTVRFVLDHADASFLASLTMDFASILSKEYADHLLSAGTPERLNQFPLGTGPFQFVNYQQDASIRYRAFSDYWGGQQPIRDLVFAITTDPGVRAKRLLAGECDVMAHPSADDLATLRRSSHLKLFEQDGLNISFLAYNTLKSPFDKPDVRRALNMAINKQAIVDTVFKGMGAAADGPLPPAVWAFDRTLGEDPYDPEAAKAALENAGVHDLQMKIWAPPVSRRYNPDMMRTAKLIQRDFAAIGVTVEIVTMEWPEYLSRSTSTDRDGAVLLGWVGDNGDPDNFLGPLLSCGSVGANNRAQWCNNEFDALLQSARRKTNVAERATLYGEAQAIFKREAPWATIASSRQISPMSAELSCFKFDALGHHNFQFCSKEGDCPHCPKSGACPQSVLAAKDECCGKSGTCPQ